MNRLVVLAVALALASAFVVPLAEAAEPVLAAAAILLVALVGFGLIVRVPFDRF